jgi:hypothetical protein
MIGGAFDVDRALTSDEALTVLGRAIPPGTTAVLASVDAPAVEVIDAEMYKLGGDVTRRPVAEVMGELEAAEEAADVAARQARRELCEKRKAEVHANLDERWKAEGEAPRLLTRTACRWPKPADRRVSASLARLSTKPSRRRQARMVAGDPDPERTRRDDELKGRSELDRLAVDSGVHRRGGAHLETRRGPRSPRPLAGVRPVEDDDPELPAVERRPRPGPARGIERVGVVRNKDDGGVEMRAAAVVD